MRHSGRQAPAPMLRRSKGLVMHTDNQDRSSNEPPALPTVLLRAVVLLLPGALLLAAVWRTLGHPQTLLVVGAAFQVVVCCLTFVTQRSWREPRGPSDITLYLTGLGWLWLGASHLYDWYPRLAEAILLIVPLTVFAVQTLTRSGAPAVRRAQVLAQLLAHRKEWPADLSACGNLPEVKALREALHLDATPALVL